MVKHVHHKSVHSEGSDELTPSCADPESFAIGVRLWLCFFPSWWGERRPKYNHKRANSGSPAKCHLNGVSLSYLWWPNIEFWLGNLVIFQRIRNSIARKPYSFVIFQGEGSGPHVPPPPGSAHAHTHSLARAFTACLLKVVDIQVRKLSPPSLKCRLYPRELYI